MAVCLSLPVFHDPYNSRKRVSADPSARVFGSALRAKTPPSENSQRRGKCWTMPRFRFQIRTVMIVIAAVAVLMATYRLLPGRFRVFLEAGSAGVVVSFVFCAAFLFF
jgi:hypothetical protein